ncbi:hypothetical protein Poly30_04730 [Planctomycetes bacterium Poly30]|uniref:HEAT repeat protein n=1 Tax=Saltatorellus ferox TaxID=2528018 RepID=A0A518ELL8_9BACT|nr:hypothetical protein Poly30_04730 [Planctomycetes bacterium Poly30]
MILAASLAALGALSLSPSGAPEPVTPALTYSSAAPRASTGQDAKKLAEQLASDQPVAERIAAAQGLAGLGKKSAPALSAMILALNDPEPQVVDGVLVALQAVGKDARLALQDILATGEYEGQEVSSPVAARVLLGMGKVAKTAVYEHMDSMEMGRDKIRFMAAMGLDGLPFIAGALGGEDPELDLAIMRSLRREAVKETRTPESVAPALERITDTATRLAFETAWLQNPKNEFITQYGAWVASDSPMLVDTGLWALGLIGKDGAAHADAVATHLDSEDPITAATAIWALTSFLEPGPGPVVPEIPATFPGASAEAAARISDSMEDDVFLLWRETGKPLGYRGRIGSKAREFWGLAPTWTGKRLPVPPTPDRSKMPASILGLEDRFFGLASGRDELLSRLASDALVALGNTETRTRDLWLKWLEGRDTAKIQSALLGLRAIGRDLIMIEEQPEITYEGLVAKHLNQPETMVAAAQVLTNIQTPSAWASVVNQISILEGKPPLGMVLAISRYDVEALRPYLPQMQDLYEQGNYMFSAFLIKFGAEALTSFEKELGSNLMDRQMVAVESLGHIGKDARALLPRLRSMKSKNTMVQKLINDAVKRIQ